MTPLNLRSFIPEKSFENFMDLGEKDLMILRKKINDVTKLDLKNILIKNYG